jgi:hypothetical protein
MLVRSKHEGAMLVEDAARCDVTDPLEIPAKVERPNNTLSQLIDEYHWITITRRHEIPSRDEMKQWAEWLGP